VNRWGSEIDVVLLGAGGLARETVEAACSENTRIIGFLDDDPAKAGQIISGKRVLGSTSTVGGLDPSVRVIAAVAASADPGRRSRLVARLELPPTRYATIVHPQASLAPSTRIGEGVIVLAGVVATSDVSIGAHVVVMPGCVLTHDVRLGAGCTLASGVQLAGGVVVEPEAYLGTGVTVREGVRIGAGAVVGMGSVVLKDVPPGQIWVGVPAAAMRRT
jgi:sugar O-acyltransferase (sialic acid O-acetyltransferase NeuD family)